MVSSPPRRSRRADAQARTQARLDAAEAAMRTELSLLWRIHVLSSLMVRRVQADPSLHSGLSLVAWRVLLTLVHAPGLSAHEITALWGFEKMAVNRGVRELTGRGLIAGGTDPHGGRRIPLTATEAGAALHAAAWPGAAHDYAALGSALSAEELATLSGLMDRLIARARDVTGG
ncbi:MarR family winged helix-turn-helix transcriptional regulator [Aquabacter spiritensis]|uniref:DNA-binding MarR family transcriptional regulator n=1 Tax=Aquabacter spiritensis TaxID=933073 RepID=A0A4R3M1R0_9HYPH|nr:MarR family transcriptional regulator [Aquabacter spiritensis]TCT06663.1 DNA-binding MarR family transcriptional regulator [Aquabacter spiritensis]